MSLFDLPSMKTAHDLKLLGISLRPITSGMTLSGRNRRRNLIREGKGLLTYILKTTPSIALIKRYVRYVESVREGQPLTISSMMYRWPFLFGFLDEPGLKTDGSHAEFALRLNAAVVLAEATTQGARRFLALGSHMGLPVCLSAMLSAVVLEIFWRASRLGANLFMKLRRRSTEL
ncbi:hypothetical protein [Pollutimonas nitritireducens]|nr:hypothetical protein [Pollutimonas nitritireducens]